MSLDFLKSPVFMRVCAGCANGNEATVNLDAESAHDTIFSLKKLMEGRTTIMAAHNEELMKAADCVIRLENGKIMKQE